MSAKKAKLDLQPLGDRVILKQDEAETATASGILIASSAQEKPQRGTVIAVGEGKLDNNGNLVKPGVKPGDSVIYSKYGGTEVTVDGEEYLILRADDIYAIYGS
ncbi:MAG: co-chaperone GroES [Coriobacteriales bacterium]|jgi:chaperonin GroES|nr:co-chaperone GroES [Coriobacteriales bacterium]